MQRPIVYLGGPYTHPSLEVRLLRFKLITLAAAKIIALGEIVFSPITMTHPIDLNLAGGDNTLGSDYWVDFDESFMNWCSEIRILTLEGWKESNGIKREIEFFKKRDLPVTFLSPSFADFTNER